jgi:hypothetical protein
MSAPGPDEEKALAELGDWLARHSEGIGDQIVLRRKGGKTEVAIDHRLACELERHAGWHVQTRPTMLPRAHFPSFAAARIKAASTDRGRALYCHDPISQEVTAALSYHLDERPHLPLLITALAFRTDVAESAFMRERTLSAALVLKHHLHSLAKILGRGGHVDIDLNKRADQLELADELGFRPAPQVKGFRPSGHHLRQPAPD